ncbi:MAG: hypothetical protein WA771_12405 [Chthoniobacterales bacterium]
MDFNEPTELNQPEPDPLEAGLRIANPNFEQTAPLTFRNESRFDLAAPIWRDATFLPILLPAITSTVDLAADGQVREIIDLEAALLEATPATSIPALLAEGHRLATEGDPRGDRVLPRLHAALRDGSLRGHFTILFAARCSVFSIPTRVAVGSYLLQELLAGAPNIQAGRALTFAATCLDQVSPTPQLRAA